jgi:hypothetical protein
MWVNPNTSQSNDWYGSGSSVETQWCHSCEEHCFVEFKTYEQTNKAMDKLSESRVMRNRLSDRTWYWADIGGAILLVLTLAALYLLMPTKQYEVTHDSQTYQPDD